MINDIECIRGALRGERLPQLAMELGVPIPAIEQFICGRAHLAPALLDGIVRILARRQNTPAPVSRNVMKLNAHALKCTAVLDATGLADPGNSSARVVLQIAVGDRIFNADVAAKSVRKCRAAIAEHGSDKVALILQGKLEGNAIVEAGLVAHVKLPRAEAT